MPLIVSKADSHKVFLVRYTRVMTENKVRMRARSWLRDVLLPLCLEYSSSLCDVNTLSDEIQTLVRTKGFVYVIYFPSIYL